MAEQHGRLVLAATRERFNVLAQHPVTGTPRTLLFLEKKATESR